MENITESNRLIAEFMGAKTKETVLPNIAERMAKQEIWLPLHGIKSISNLNYHTSFDWLMPVVDRIERQGYNSKCWYILDRNMYQMQFFAKDFIKDIFQDADTRIKATYQAVIEFIKWYNQQSKIK